MQILRRPAIVASILHAFKTALHISKANVVMTYLPAGRGGALLGQSPNLFLETLTHRSSWVMKSARLGENPNSARRPGSMPFLDDHNLQTLEEGTGHSSSSSQHDGEPLGDAATQEALPGYAKLPAPYSHLVMPCARKSSYFAAQSEATMFYLNVPLLGNICWG